MNMGRCDMDINKEAIIDIKMKRCAEALEKNKKLEARIEELTAQYSSFEKDIEKTKADKKELLNKVMDLVHELNKYQNEIKSELNEEA